MMNSIKIARLHQNSCNQLMQIKVNGHSIDGISADEAIQCSNNNILYPLHLLLISHCHLTDYIIDCVSFRMLNSFAE